MRSKLVLGAVGAALAAMLLGATGAAAATEVGNRCSGNQAKQNVIMVSAANAPGDPLPAAIPSGGVITRWSFSAGLPIPPGSSFRETLKVFRPTTNPGQLQVVGESAPEFIANGTQTFPTRIPVRAGDLIGGLGETTDGFGSIYCETSNPGDAVGLVPNTAPLGSTVVSAGGDTEVQIPIVVTVEPDADNDGFGDETQDQCPQSAATQGACPPVVPLPFSLSAGKQVRKGSVTIVVTASTAAPVSVDGVVKLGKGKKAKLSGGTKDLAPGALGKFTLKFTKKVKKKLGELPPKRSLRLNVTVSGTSVSGAVAAKKLKVKLKGQG